MATAIKNIKPRKESDIVLNFVDILFHSSNKIHLSWREFIDKTQEMVRKQKSYYNPSTNFLNNQQ